MFRIMMALIALATTAGAEDAWAQWYDDGTSVTYLQNHFVGVRFDDSDIPDIASYVNYVRVWTSFACDAKIWICDTDSMPGPSDSLATISDQWLFANAWTLIEFPSPVPIDGTHTLWVIAEGIGYGGDVIIGRDISLSGSNRTYAGTAWATLSTEGIEGDALIRIGYDPNLSALAPTTWGSIKSMF